MIAFFISISQSISLKLFKMFFKMFYQFTDEVLIWSSGKFIFLHPSFAFSFSFRHFLKQSTSHIFPATYMCSPPERRTPRVCAPSQDSNRLVEIVFPDSFQPLKGGCRTFRTASTVTTTSLLCSAKKKTSSLADSLIAYTASQKFFLPRENWPRRRRRRRQTVITGKLDRLKA